MLNINIYLSIQIIFFHAFEIPFVKSDIWDHGAISKLARTFIVVSHLQLQHVHMTVLNYDVNQTDMDAPP